MQNILKIEGGLFGDIKKFSKKSPKVKKLKWGTLQSGPVLSVTLQKKNKRDLWKDQLHLSSTSKLRLF